MIIELSDTTDPRLDDYLRLTDVNLRKKLETDRGLYMAESTKVIMRAIQAGHTPRSFLTSVKWLPALTPWVELATGHKDGGEVPVYVAPETVLEAITGYKVHRGALAAMNRPVLPAPDELLARARHGRPARRVVVLEALVDHTNVGAIFRSCAALGIDAVLVTDDCADPLYRRSVRVSMGTVFQVPWTRIHNWPHSIHHLHDAGFVTAALALVPHSLPLDEFSALPQVRAQDSKVALIMGTEGDGLKPQTIATADYSVVIPMDGGVDSLNVAAASAVACWELRVRDDA
ncbi:tRNA G18 (ribose-2'-O)-methylase SpoU [Actinobaculum suis]|uniref:RNA methyltransferase n=1 Tax=Actinobaculum suis TaxID=1657 RepID=A0A0K9ERZ8_9ACTO|nr:RNA methyltransferase [Actinobaculum suis]KMY22655.1 rRNA methyltransferase [Actinobaculum suis]MDY5153044.1 RNA methyltransferase [Actinobaculum suis]SDE60985.1 tRNA G18 (ribose-2'-O)-methylase SpoU [Actinobaculum suis]